MHSRAFRLFQGRIVVKSNEGSLLLNVSNNLEPGTLATDWLNAVLSKELNHSIGENPTGNEVLFDGVRDREALEHRNSMGDTIAGVDNETSGTAISIKREDSLDGNVEVRDLECLEHKLSHFLSISLRVLGSLREKKIVLRRIDSELVAECIGPDLLHSVPVIHDTGLNGVLEIEDTSHLLCLIADILIFRFDTNHLLRGSRSTHDGRELNGGLLLASETGLQDAGSIINDDGLIVSHFVCLFVFFDACV